MAAEARREREYKFDVDADYDPPDLRTLVEATERLPAVARTTTYVDTPDLRLWQRGLTLLHRVEEPGDTTGVWTLEAPGGVAEEMDGRPLTWPGAGSAVPPEAAAIVTGLVRRAELAPVATLEAERRRLLLHGWRGAGDDDGRPGRPPSAARPGEDLGPWAELDDDVVAVTSGPRAGLRFRQIELAVRAGGDGLADARDAVVDALSRAGAAPGGKARFAIAVGPGPAVPAGADSGRTGASRGASAGKAKRRSLAAAVATVLRADLDRLLDWDYRLRIPAGGDLARPDAGALSEARTAARRAAADIRALEAVLDPVWARHVADDLESLDKLLGRLCEEDALVERIGGHGDPADAEAVGELIRLLRAERHLDAVELSEALRSDRYLDMLDRLHAASVTPPLVVPDGGARGRGRSGRALRAAITAQVRAARHAVSDLGPAPAAEDLHHLLVLARRLRYGAEAAGSHLGGGGKVAARVARVARRAGKLQAALGEVREAQRAAQALRQLGSHPSVSPAVAFVAGRLAGEAEAEAASLGRRWRKAARRVATIDDL